MSESTENKTMVEMTNEEKIKKLEQQIIYYSYADQVDLTTYSDDTESIDLSMTRLNRINDFSKFINLKTICFRGNLLKTLSDANLDVDKGLHNIKELDFYDNQIEKIENLEQFKTLELLDLSFNRFTKIENLNELVELKKLFLVHNQFGKIENLNCLVKLELLELGDNQLRVIENLSSLKNLTQL